MVILTDTANIPCLLCKTKGASPTGKKPRDRECADIVSCNYCGHIQMFPLLAKDEEAEEYNIDKSVRFGKIKISDGSDFESMRTRFSEWTKEHVNIYFDTLQNYENVLEMGAGYGFFMEGLNNRPNKKFNIEGIEIGEFRRDNFVGGVVYNVNALVDNIPESLRNKYDCVICIHVLEHIRDPVLFLERIKLFLNQKGNVIFEVPNINNFLCEISPEYKNFFFQSVHCSYFSTDTLRLAFEKAGYIVESIKSHETHSIENHCRWVREGTPFTKNHQMFMPHERLEWINEIYKEEIGKQGKGSSLIIKAKAI